MEFIEGNKYIVTSKTGLHGFKIGDKVIFQSIYEDNEELGRFERVRDGLCQIVMLSEVRELSYDLEATDYIADTELIAKVNFKGFGEPRVTYKTYHFKTTISDLEKGEIVIVDSKGELQCANFLGYLKEGEVHVSPTKYIISRFTTEAVQSKKLDRYTLENKGVKKISTKTEILFLEIEAFHKKNLIDKYLDERNFDALRELL